jgi:hypothetical protein
MLGVDGSSVELGVLDDVRVGLCVPVVGDKSEPLAWSVIRNA